MMHITTLTKTIAIILLLSHTLMSCSRAVGEKLVDPSAKSNTGKARQEQAVIYAFPNSGINTAFGGQQEIEGEFTEASLQAYLFPSTMPSCLGLNYPLAHSSTCQANSLYAAEQLAYDAINYLGVPPQGQEYMALPPMLHPAANNPPIAFQEGYFIHGHGAKSNRDAYPFMLPATLTHPHVAAVPTPAQVTSATKMSLSQQQALQAHRSMEKDRQHADSTQQTPQGFSNQVMSPTLTPHMPYVSQSQLPAIWSPWWNGTCIAENFFSEDEVDSSITEDKTVHPSLYKPVADGNLPGDVAFPGNQPVTSQSLLFNTPTLVPTSGVIILEEPQGPIQDPFIHLIASIASGQIGEKLDLSGQKFQYIQWKAIGDALKNNSSIYHFDFSDSSFGKTALRYIKPIWCRSGGLSSKRNHPIQCHLQRANSILSSLSRSYVDDLISIILDENIGYLDIRNCGNVQDKAWKGALIQAIWAARKGGKTVLCDPSLDKPRADGSLQGDGLTLEGDVAFPGNQPASLSLPFNTPTLVPTSGVITLKEPQKPIQDPFAHLIASIASGQIGEELDVSNQSFTRHQWKHMGTALKSNSNIYHFNFSDSNLGPLALCYIQPALCKPRTRPTSLDLHGLRCDLLSLQQPQRRKNLILLVLNKNISYLNIQHCGMPRDEMWRKELVKAIMEARSMGKTVLCDDLEIFQTTLNPIEVPVSDQLGYEGLLSSKQAFQALETSPDEETPPSKKRKHAHDM